MNLIVWQKAMDLFEMAWKLTVVEASIDFKLRSQFVDAAQSISANIAEGYGRRSINEYIQFLYTSLGSMAETLTRAIGLRQIQQIPTDRFDQFNKLHYEVENRLLRLIEKLEQKRDNGDWMNRIAEDSEEYSPTPSLQDSTTPAAESLHHSTTPSLRASGAAVHA
ncbi:MAG TPA: four helix bundle protein [Chthoniobacterales bacterium]|nr:four helix bundle protein [Chthoniobacterales bacterium]